MPIHIKPTHDLGPCVLDRHSIENIVKLVEKNFPAAIFSAHDGVWEVYDEPGGSFLRIISVKETLDSFVVDAKENSTGNDRELRMVFDEDEATVSLKANPNQEDWFEHFLFDLKKFILPPLARQVAIHRYGKLNLTFTAMVIPFNPRIFNPRIVVSTPYCKIVIRKKPPNPFIENVKAGVTANLFWAIIIFAFGVTFTMSLPLLSNLVRRLIDYFT